MNREWVEVMAVEPNGIWVESLQQSACASCSARAGCGQQTLYALGRSVRLWVPTREAMQIGQSVMLELPKGGLALSAAMLYGIPLIGLAVGAALGQTFGSDGFAVMGGLILMGIGLLVSKQCTKRYQYLWQPKLLNRCASNSIACDVSAEK